MENRNPDGSEQENNSENGPIVFPSRELMEEEMVKMMIQIIRQQMEPSAEEATCSSVENSDALKILRKELRELISQIIRHEMVPYVKDRFRGVVREDIQSVLEKWSIGANRNHEAETILELKFLDEISSPVLTGKEIKSTEDKPIGLALIDKNTSRIVDRGPESSLKAEIKIREVNNKPPVEGEHSRAKPHFSKTPYVDLKEGVGFLCNAKLGQVSKWTKNCECKLVARSEENLGVREGWSEPFVVKDSRSMRKGKSPSLCDPLQKLKNIGIKGDPIDRLRNKNVKTVKDFLFWLSVDPQLLQEIFTGKKGEMMNETARARWNATVEHAKTCIIDDVKTYLYFPSSDQSERGVAYDAVGGIQGLIIDRSHFVPVDDLSQDEKEHGRLLLMSAFENPNDVQFFRDRTCLVEQYPHRWNDPDTGNNTSKKCSNMHDPGSGYHSSNSDSAVSSPSNSEERRRCQILMAELESICKNPSLPVLEENTSKENNNPREFVASSSQPSRVSYSRFSVFVFVMLWRKKLMDLGGVRVHKRQRIY